MKRFLIIGIIGVAFSLVGCSYVGPNADGGNWWDGLSRQEVFEATTVVVNGTDAIESRADETVNKNVKITWALPFELPVCPKGGAFTIEWSYNEDFSDPQDVVIDDADLSITKGKVAWEVSDVYVYKFSKYFSFKVTEYIVYFKLRMTDHNGAEYQTIVSFMVFPKSKILRIRTAPAETDADAINALYRIDYTQFEPSVNLPEGSRLLFNDAALDDGEVPSSTNETLDALNLFQIAILTDLSDILGEDVKLARYSNTSFCKVTPVVEKMADADATLRYSFEDLPLQMLETEDAVYDAKTQKYVRRFDYNDVVVYVDILDGVVK